MGLIQKATLGLVSSFILLISAVGIAQAASNGQSVSGTNNRTVYKVGNSVDINGTVNGDIFCAGQTVDINATVNGDIICAAQTLNVSGEVNGSVRLAGQSVNLMAKVAKNALVVGQNANLDATAAIGQDLTILAQNSNVNSSVGRDLNGRVSQLTLNSTIGRNVSVNCGQLTLGSHSQLNGSLDYTSRNHLIKNGGAVVAGTISYHQPTRSKSHWRSPGWAFVIYLAISLLILDLVLVAIWPRLFGRSLTLKRFWWSLLTGFIAMFAVPAIIIALTVSVVGIPLAVLVGLIWLVINILSVPLAAFFTGGQILRNEKRAPLIMLVGAVVLGLVSLIPILGFLVMLVAVWYGTGTLLQLIKGSLPKHNYRLQR